MTICLTSAVQLLLLTYLLVEATKKQRVGMETNTYMLHSAADAAVAYSSWQGLTTGVYLGYCRQDEKASL